MLLGATAVRRPARGQSRERKLRMMSVTTRRERRERELRRKQREGRSSGPHGRRGGGGGINPLLIAAGIVIAVALLIFAGQQAKLFTPPAPTASPIPTPAVSPNDPAFGIKEKDAGTGHTAGTAVTYASLPPTSGSHWSAPAAPAPWGIKDTQLPNEVTVHNLEHGGIVIVYSPSLAPAEVTALKDSVRNIMNTTRFKKIILEPYKELTGGVIALTAWDWILKLPAPDQAAMVKFITAHYEGSDAPEPAAP